jgi:hypothetical protein
VGCSSAAHPSLQQSEGPESSRLRKLRPYERSRCAEHGELDRCVAKCARPTGGGMVAPPTAPRNALVVKIA